MAYGLLEQVYGRDAGRERQVPSKTADIAYTFSNNIINKHCFRCNMASSVHQLSDNEREWFDYFMESYTKEQMILKYIGKLRQLNKATGAYDGVLYD